VCIVWVHVQDAQQQVEPRLELHFELVLVFHAHHNVQLLLGHVQAGLVHELGVQQDRVEFVHEGHGLFGFLGFN